MGRIWNWLQPAFMWLPVSLFQITTDSLASLGKKMKTRAADDCRNCFIWLCSHISFIKLCYILKTNMKTKFSMRKTHTSLCRALPWRLIIAQHYRLCNLSLWAHPNICTQIGLWRPPRKLPDRSNANHIVLSIQPLLPASNMFFKMEKLFA